jgi:hypothetical protein
MKKIFLFFIFTYSISLFTQPNNQDTHFHGVPKKDSGNYRSPFANPDFGSPAIVRVGFLLVSITSYSIKDGKFSADFYISFTSDKPMPGKVFPHLTNGYIEDDVQIVTITDQPTFKLWKIHGIFYTNPDLRDYPFDLQVLEIQIEENDSGIDQIFFVADQKNTNLNTDFFMPGWEVHFLESRTLKHYYPDRFDHDDLYYPRYFFRLGIKRYATNALFTVFLPAFVILFVSLSAIWLKIENLDTRINTIAPMLAATVLFHYTLVQELPATAYLTRADKVMLAVYLGLIVNMLATWSFFFFDKKHSDKIYLLGKVIVPPLNIVLFLMGIFL